MNIERSYGRKADQLRPMKVQYNSFGYADGSVLFEIGNTKVLCTVSLVNQVPPFIRNKKQWWLTASYALLPNATHIRTERESVQKRNDRSAEISRLIGRCFRSVVKLDNKESEKTIHIDCDVLQADGGTRTACITASSLALELAQKQWILKGEIKEPIVTDRIAGVSIGLHADTLLLDIDYAEDSKVQADFNFILTEQDKVVEVQGCAERASMTWSQMHAMQMMAQTGVREIFKSIENKALENYSNFSVNAQQGSQPSL